MFRIIRRYHFNKIDSTSAYLLRRRFDLPSFTFVSADFQTDGKGRTDRVWHSNSGENLLFSFIVKGELAQKFSSLSIATATTIIKLLKDLGIQSVSFKWPNDVYINGQKVCGILLQSVSDNGKIDEIVIGVGLNVNQTQFLGEYLTHPTSVKLQLKKDINVKKLRTKLFSKLKREFILVEKNKSNYLRVANDNNFLLNKNVNALINGEIHPVTAGKINADNTLEVVVGNKIISVNSGEITFHI